MENMLNINKLGDIAIGLYDIPYSPEATVLYTNLLKANAVIYGGPMTGKTTMIKNILARMHEEEPYCSWENIYILDFGNNLESYAYLGRVCAYFDSYNEENIKRIFKIVEQKFYENSRALESENFMTYQENHPDNPLGHITLVIDNITAFLSEERYSQYYDSLFKIVRDGPSKGISVLCTASDSSGIITRMKISFQQKYALDLPVEKYSDIFDSKVTPPMKIPGRGLSVVDSKICEFQAFLPFNRENEQLEELCQKTKDTGIEKLKSFPTELTEDNIKEFCSTNVNGENGKAFIGLDYYSHTDVSVDFDEAHGIAIYGRKQFGKTNLLTLLLRGFHLSFEKATYVFFDDAKKQLFTFHEGILQMPGNSSYYFTDVSDIRDYLLNNINGKDCILDDKDPTVFIIQNKTAYRTKAVAADQFLFMNAMEKTEGKNFYYFYTDVPKLSNSDVSDSFNPQVDVAFVLDNIGEFVQDKGVRSVLSTYDAKELKKEYARCEIGDGYFYDTAKDDLIKFKAIKTNNSLIK